MSKRKRQLAKDLERLTEKIKSSTAVVQRTFSPPQVRQSPPRENRSRKAPVFLFCDGCGGSRAFTGTAKAAKKERGRAALGGAPPFAVLSSRLQGKPLRKQSFLFPSRPFLAPLAVPFP